MDRYLKVLLASLFLALTLGLAVPSQALAAGTVAVNKAKASINVGDTLSLQAASSGQLVEWSSSKPSVATVENGRVVAKKAGLAVITARTDSGIATCEVVVKRSNAREGVYRYVGTTEEGVQVQDSLYVLSRAEGKITFVLEHVEKSGIRHMSGRIVTTLKGNRTGVFFWEDDQGGSGVGVAIFKGKRVTVKMKAVDETQGTYVWPEQSHAMTLTDAVLTTEEKRVLGRF